MASNREQLNPVPGGHLLATLRRAALGPRMVLFRKLIAGMLFLLAGLLALLPDQPASGDEVSVVVAARDLTPGRILVRDDLTRRSLPARLAPAGALRETSLAEGHMLSGAARAGEPLTDVRFTGDALTRLTAGDHHAAVPIRLADPGVADFLHLGQRVDIITNEEHSNNVMTLAEHVPVLAIRPAEGRHDQGRLIVVGLPEQAAATAAAAALTNSVTVTLR